MADTGVNNAAIASGGYARRPNPVFSSEYGVVREVLIEARRQAGLSQRALAARLEKTGSHVAMIERGQRRVDLLEFCRMADCMGLPAEVLVRRIEERLRRQAQAASADAGSFARAS
ncbi:helix-turn-helix domain-containing protein [Phenylobacterium zucineum]|uniref:helix-turn-helix domain-containing protein n=1 Tax=Phenylobacterium zucineum TaxID=284016 RepID=UPI001F22350C|nr:helix-turn-helix transcriptional regulator [Phenylobacterium zucineum]